MMNRGLTKQHALRRGRYRGLGLIEMLAALLITSSLLTATAVAIDAAYRGYKVNQERSTLLNRSRLVLNRMFSMVRTSSAHEPYSADAVSAFVAGGEPTDSGIKMLDEDGRVHSIYYDPHSEELRWSVDGSYGQSLLRGVKQFTVEFEPEQSADGKRQGIWDEMYRCTITIKVGYDYGAGSRIEMSGDHTVTLSGSIMPRANAF